MDVTLTLEQQEKLEEALRKAYNLDGLTRMLRLKLGFNLADEIGVVGRGLKVIVNDLVQQAMDNGWVDKLVLGARGLNQGNPSLKQIANELNIVPAVAVPAETVKVTGNGQAYTLEKAVQKRAPLMNFTGFMNKLSDIGKHICRIEYPTGQPQGTGWLVGPDLLLTAYHVIEDIDKSVNGLTRADLLCRFDYTETQLSGGNTPGRTCQVAAQWLIDKSPYAVADMAVVQDEPTALELDYALIRLAEKVGDDMIETKKRGWITVKENAPVLASNDFVIIPQHPDGRILELAFGEILNYNKSANRVRYDTNTESGSSGSPCFNIELFPFGLHHAAGPKDNLNYNQAVPLREIIKAMKKKNTEKFWTS